MTKEVQMFVKMKSELLDRLMAVAAAQHRPAAQIIRDQMNLSIADSEMPNALTADTIRKGLQGDDVFHASNDFDLFKQLET